MQIIKKEFCLQSGTQMQIIKKFCLQSGTQMQIVIKVRPQSGTQSKSMIPYTTHTFHIQYSIFNIQYLLTFAPLIWASDFKRTFHTLLM